MAVWAYFTVGALLWTRSTDKISEVISHFASVQSNSEALEGSCQSMVYKSVLETTHAKLVRYVAYHFSEVLLLVGSLHLTKGTTSISDCTT